ncbi:hypothetical protein GUITHDRAFT_149075 [Guillardia theta CCMP2712]|uniref:FAM86 N-terminal domain-containing protein n=1 Tax=Guillardia theta (strain CCMP2712) TaxID=905079 RepID=L1I7H5_GUITC|nr:hypothetical protein GUITHDRAFT_149075 [Guillardia theta CCMP2712]EKX31785.1 hypothetical protein GUITHDRAFT_149075 [Guillardia theta CCMP2712]|eukprot:XP_005818765.1 hypothetical protein GUITHDRAFT_149075 [Guillardia theta CCMP2712]
MVLLRGKWEKSPTEWLKHVRHPSTVQPPTKHGVRVVVIEAGKADELRTDVTINPCFEPRDLPWPLEAEQASHLTSCGLAISLVESLRRNEEGEIQSAILKYLDALVSVSEEACHHLNRYKELPLDVGVKPSDEDRACISRIEQLCYEHIDPNGYGESVSNWSGWAALYEVWVRNPKEKLSKLKIYGVEKKMSSFDFGGAHLTGGRIWASSLLLIRWLSSIAGALLLGEGPILELGAGLGVVGIALAKQGHKVVVSDREPALLARMQENVEVNQVERTCKVLDLDWAEVAKPRVSKLLKAQGFSSVVAADIIYEEEMADLILGVLPYALPRGGNVVIITPLKHRKGTVSFKEKLERRGFEFSSQLLHCNPSLHELFAYYEPDQEYLGYVIRIKSS